MNYILLIIGFILIIKASDVLIDSSKEIALKFKVPKILIALTVVAFGTSAPELAISFKSVMTNNGSMALSNVIGSYIVNILLAISLTAINHPIKVKNETIKKELPLLVLITTVFSSVILSGILFKNNNLNTFDGLILFSLFILFVVYIVKLVKKRHIKIEEISEEKRRSILKPFLYIIISTIVIIISADLLVDSAVIIANELHISEKVIAMVVIVIGTSLPEIFLTAASVRKKEHEMAIGNIIGTNIFNICIVLGLPTIAFNGFKIIDFNIIDIGVVFISSILLYLFAKSEKTLSRKEGFLMISIFVIYYIYVIFI